MPNLQIGQIPITDRKCNNKTIGKILKCIFFHDYTRDTNIRISKDNLTITDKYAKYIKWPISPEGKELQFY